MEVNCVDYTEVIFSLERDSIFWSVSLSEIFFFFGAMDATLLFCTTTLIYNVLSTSTPYYNYYMPADEMIAWLHYYYVLYSIDIKRREEG